MSDQPLIVCDTSRPSQLKPNVPFIADAISIVLHLLLGGWLLKRFAIPPTDIPDFAAQTDETVQLQVLDGEAFRNLLILLGLYLCFLIGFFIIRKLYGDVDERIHGNRPLHIVTALLFGLGLTFAMTEMTAFFDNIDTIQSMGEVGNGYIVMFTPAIFIFASLLYLFLLIMPPELRYESGRTAIVALVLINLLLMGIVSYIVAFSQRTTAGSNQMMLLLASIIIGGMMLVLPRLFYAARTRQWLAIVSFVILLLAIPAISIFVHA